MHCHLSSFSGDFINSQTAFYGPGYPAQNGIRLLQVYQYHAQALLVFLENAFAIYVDSEEYKGSRQAKAFSEVMITISFLLWLVLFYLVCLTAVTTTDGHC